MNRKFNEEMVVLARESRNWTQSKLSEESKLTQAAISMLEKGELDPKEESILNLSDALEVTPNFFYKQDLNISNNIIFFYRKRQLSKKLLRHFESKSKMICMHLKKMHELLNIDNNRLTSLQEAYLGKNASNIAKELRKKLGLGKGPILNLTEVVEKLLGITVIEMDFLNLNLDGYHIKYDNTPPVIFVNKYAPGDRARFTLAHELGHLLLHRDLDEDTEDEANIFASEFLVPKETIKKQLENLDIKKLKELKAEWKTSMQAILMKAKNTNVIPYNRYNYLWIQMSRLGFRKKEPMPIQREISTNFKKTLQRFATHYKNNLDRVSEELFLTKNGFLRMYSSLSLFDTKQLK